MMNAMVSLDSPCACAPVYGSAGRCQRRSPSLSAAYSLRHEPDPSGRNADKSPDCHCASRRGEVHGSSIAWPRDCLIELEDELKGELSDADEEGLSAS